MPLNSEVTIAQELIDRAELSLQPGKPYAYTVTREGTVLRVDNPAEFTIQPGDEFAVTAPNKGG